MESLEGRERDSLKFCATCGAALRKLADNFCRQCGARLNSDTARFSAAQQNAHVATRTNPLTETAGSSQPEK